MHQLRTRNFSASNLAPHASHFPTSHNSHLSRQCRKGSESSPSAHPSFSQQSSYKGRNFSHDDTILIILAQPYRPRSPCEGLTATDALLLAHPSLCNLRFDKIALRFRRALGGGANGGEAVAGALVTLVGSADVPNVCFERIWACADARLGEIADCILRFG